MGAGEKKKITTTNVNIQVMNAQLIAHGFIRKPIPWDTIEGPSSVAGGDNKLKESVLNCLLTMLERRSDDLDRFENLTARYRSLAGDLSRMENSSNQMKMHLRTTQRQVDSLMAEKAANQSSSKSSQSHSRELKAESSRAKANVTWIRTQSQAEMRKMEKEQARLTERLTKMADEQMKIGRIGIRYANPEMAPKSLGLQHSATTSLTNLQDKGKQAVEGRLRALEVENSQLKDLLAGFYQNVTQTLAHDNGLPALSPGACPTIAELDSSVQQIQERIVHASTKENHPSSADDRPSREESQRLERELTEAQKTIGDLKKVLQDLSRNHRQEDHER